MRSRNLREKTLAHLATAAAITLIAGLLASGPLGLSPLLAQQYQTNLLPSPGAMAPPTKTARTDLATRTGDSELSFRGARPADSPTPDSTFTPQPVLSPTSIPAQTAAATAWPTPTAPPTATAQPVATPPLAPVPPPTLRVGIQAGHWKNSELPSELASLRGSTGAEGQGWREVDINLDIARRVAALLQQANIQVDLIPATVPVRYKADAFVALHGDANSPGLSGYKLARANWSSIPQRDDALLSAISQQYAAATGIKEHRATITAAMVAYYAFDRNLDHAVAATTPAVILEMGFLTNPGDRKLLTEQQDTAAGGIARGILKFLGR